MSLRLWRPLGPTPSGGLRLCDKIGVIGRRGSQLEGGRLLPPDLAPSEVELDLPVSTPRGQHCIDDRHNYILPVHNTKVVSRQTPTAESVEVDDDLSAGRHVPFGNVGEGLGHEGAEDDDVKGGHGPAKDTEAGTHSRSCCCGGQLPRRQPGQRLRPQLAHGRMAGRVYVAGADHDDSYPLEMASRLDQSLSEAGVDHRCEIYPEAAWLDDEGLPGLRRGCRRRHWNELGRFFADTLT